MNSPKIYAPGEFHVDTTPMIVGACLVGAAAIIGMTGMIVGGTAIISATRQWLQELDVPPSEVVKQKLSQTKAATAAGASAWQRHNAMQQTSRA
jgi:4-hydroxy-3-methylbut-2-en-1-yl diphosphate synthase IspG/GcpE